MSYRARDQQKVVRYVSFAPFDRLVSDLNSFQFTGQRFYAIEDGELNGQLRGVAYQATTTEEGTA